MAYGEEYSDQNIGRMRDLYAQSQQSAFDRATAQLMTSLGGRGALYGSPYFNKGGQLATQLAGNVAGYEAGLRGQGLEATRGERLLGEQRAYERPFTEAGLTGMYGGQQTLAGLQLANQLAQSKLEQQYYPSQFTGQLPGGGTTFQRQQWEQMSPYQTAMINATNQQKQLEQTQAYYNMLATLLGTSGVSSALGGALQGIGGTAGDLWSQLLK